MHLTLGGATPIPSVYSQLCWHCIRKSRTSRTQRRQASSSSTSSDPVFSANSKVEAQQRIRRFHHVSKSSQSAPAVARSDTSQAPEEGYHWPIRDRLKRWQERNGNPLSDILGVNTPFGVRSLAPEHYGGSERPGEEEADPNNDGEEDEFLPETYDQDVATYGGAYLKPGDLVELSSTRTYAPRTIAVFIRELSSRQIQLITMRGKWIVVGQNSIQFSIPGFMSPRLIASIEPYLPQEEVIEELLGQSHIIDPSIPRTITSPIVTALSTFNNAAEEVYRKNAAALDKAHDALAHATDLRFGTLERITDRLIPDGDMAPRMAVMYAVRKAINSAGVAFGIDKRSHRVTGVFQIRPKEQVNWMRKVIDWLREYQDDQVATKMREADPTTADHSSPHPTEGVQVIRDFIEKAKGAVQESRKHRSATYIGQGAIGPSSQRFSLKSRGGAIRTTPTIAFTEDERIIIRVLEYASVQAIVETEETMRSLLPIILRDTGMYHGPYEIELGRRAFYSFLLEIGVMVPYEDTTRYDVNLLLPSSQLSKPLQQLATTLEQMDPSKVKLTDSLRDIRTEHKDRIAFAIDDAGAEEIDDAISLERVPGTDSVIWAHIHVADPTSFISRDSVFARMAAHLTESFYAPDRTTPLLPAWLSRKTLGLGSGQPCITISAMINLNGDLLEVKVQAGRLDQMVRLEPAHIANLLGFSQTEADMNRDPMVVGGELPTRKAKVLPELSPGMVDDLKTLNKFAAAKYNRRLRDGGFDYSLSSPNMAIYQYANRYGLDETYPHRHRAVRTDGDPVIAIFPTTWKNPFDVSTDRLRIVQEMMLLAGQAISQWAQERDIPLAFRTLRTRPGALSFSELQNEVILPAIAKYGSMPTGLGFQVLSGIGSVQMQTTPGPHPFIGLFGYTKATSPLRRYGDMIAHWQIGAALREEARFGHKALTSTKRHDYLPFSRPQMENVISRLAPRERLLNASKNRSRRHWLTQFIFRAKHFNEYPIPERLNVIVYHESASLNSHEPKAIVVWKDTSIILKMYDNAPDGERLQAGDEWEAEITVIAPYYPDVILTPIRLVHREQPIDTALAEVLKRK